jgi:4-aminobutyrate aminotransferase-like enzyme
LGWELTEFIGQILICLPDRIKNMNKKHIKTDLPGPKARELLARDALVVSPSYPRDYPFVMSHGKGAEIWDVDGNRFLDFAAGIAVCSTGHSHPAVVQAIKDAADAFCTSRPTTGTRVRSSWPSAQ